MTSAWIGYTEHSHHRSPFLAVRPDPAEAGARNQVCDLVGYGLLEELVPIFARDLEIEAQYGRAVAPPHRLARSQAAQVESQARLGQAAPVACAQW
jgi:hypothetical protein